MRGISLLCGYLFFLITANAQIEDVSLTEEFPNLSAKERARIAKKEAKEASGDLVFQTFMKSADSLFQLSEYNTAMDMYIDARKQRPYNVHPKVKIQDLQGLIAQEEQMNGELANLEEAPPIVVSDLNGPPPIAEPSPALEGQNITPDLPERKNVLLVVNDNEAERQTESKPRSVKFLDKKPFEKEVEKQEPKQEITARVEPSVFDIPLAEDGVNKEVYREGNAVITQLTVVREGRTDVYKKVYHQWGYVFYFKNGSAITERMWADETLTFY